MGVPKLDAAKRREVLAILAMGGSRQTAAHYVGCHPDTIRRTGERDAGFLKELQQAASKHELRHLKNIDAAAADARYWRAAAWALERSYPERYAARLPRGVTTEELEEALQTFASALGNLIDEEPLRRRVLGRLRRVIRRLRQSIQGEQA